MEEAGVDSEEETEVDVVEPEGAEVEVETEEAVEAAEAVRDSNLEAVLE